MGERIFINLGNINRLIAIAFQILDEQAAQRLLRGDLALEIDAGILLELLERAHPPEAIDIQFLRHLRIARNAMAGQVIEPLQPPIAQIMDALVILAVQIFPVQRPH